MSISPKGRQFFAVVAALLCAASMWFYVRRISVPRQVIDGSRLERPRGNLSDLYPRWLGARELLLRGRDPYSREITREIQRGYYGRELDASRPNDPKDQNGFAYPVYVVFLLAPFLHMDFAAVRFVAIWVLAGLAAWTVLLWQQTLGIAWPRWCTLTVAVLLLGSYPFIEAIALQQPILLVAALLAGAFLARQSGRLFLSGVLLAVCTIKPQVALLPVILMLLWVSGDWRARRRWLWGFLAAMVALLSGAEYVLPGWIPRFYAALRAYQSYMAGTSFLDWLVTPHWSGPVAAVIVLPVLWTAWKCRRENADAAESRRTLCLVLTAGVCVAPNLALYNQVLLLPVVLFLYAEREIDRGGNSAGNSGNSQRAGFLVHMLDRAVVGLVAWPWIATGILIVARFVFRAESFVQRAWELPLYATLALPVVLLVLLLLSPVSTQRTFPLPERLA